MLSENDSVELAIYEGKGLCSIYEIDSKKMTGFSNKFQLDNIDFIEPSLNLFSFNNPFGACKKCEGFGDIIGIDKELSISTEGWRFSS